MASIPSDYPVTRQRRGLGDRLGDHGLKAITLAAALAAVVLLGAIVWKVMELAWPAIQHYGLSFLTSATWDPGRSRRARPRSASRRACGSTCGASPM